jgi:N6-L-threonylcarbamoyladenine synthase
MKKFATILGIESSCDETGVALLAARRTNQGWQFNILKNLVYSQILTHREFGGVVPEVAAREHAVHLPLLFEALAKTKAQKTWLAKNVDAVAVTSGPGLITCLLVGVEFAKTISAAWKKPLLGINHLEGHIYSNLLSSTKTAEKNFGFPTLCLIVSGAHTELVLMNKHLQYKIIGSTKDDAVGEAFDKTAKLLGLDYPGGPALSALAKKGSPTAVKFPRAMLGQPNLDFSFAGLKTAVAIYKSKHPTSKADLAASFEAAAVETLVGKTIQAAKKYKPKTVVLAGGVAANLPLRSTLKQTFAKQFPEVQVLEPDLKFATDNAAMIATAGAVRFMTGKYSKKLRVEPRPELK